jgi:hypothetical protein
MAGGVYMPVSRPTMMADEPQIKRTRKILVIIVGVCLVSSRRAGTLLVYFEASEFVFSRPWP